MLAYTIGFVLVILAGWILAVATGWALPYDLLDQGLDWLKGNPWESTVLAALFLVVGLLLFFRPREKKEYSYLAPSKWGEVRVTYEALQEIIARSAMAIVGVRHVQASLRQMEDGLEIKVVAHLSPDLVIPETSVALQEQVQKDVEHFTGIRVSEVKVLVRSLEPARVARVR